MLRLFRVRAWCLATALFLAMGTAGTSLDVLLHGGAAHHNDPCAAETIAAHDEAAHRIAGPPNQDADGAGSHCVACHLARALRLRTEPASLSTLPDDGRTLGVPSSIGIALAPVLANAQPRSPPVA